MVNRHKLQIISKILKVAEKGAKVNVIMNYANLNSVQWYRRYLPKLMNCELINIENNNGNGKIYRTSEKGKRFIKSYGGIETLLENN